MARGSQSAGDRTARALLCSNTCAGSPRAGHAACWRSCSSGRGGVWVKFACARTLAMLPAGPAPSACSACSTSSSAVAAARAPLRALLDGRFSTTL